jgi:flagellar motor switch protein FliN/FliY
MSEEPQSQSPASPAAGGTVPRAPGPASPGLDLVLDVPLRLTVEIGAARMLVQEVLQLDVGSVVELDRMAGEPADLLVNGRVVARGEVVVSEDRLSIRLLEITGAGRGSA